jgi:enoyl-CoA hydratase/carnithine racemase
MIDSRLEGAVSVLTINRPQRRNALSDDTVLALKKHLRENETNPAVRVTVITGSSPGFCAGSDLKELATMDLRGMCEHEADTGRFCRSISQMRKPVIAAVEGFALGGGFVFAASCDIVVSSESCRWHLPEVRIGWIPPWGLEALVARLGPVAARRFTWGSEECDGIEGYRVGLVDYLAADGKALDTALDVANRIAALPDVAVASAKAYFAPHAGANGETGDVIANQMFEENCKHPVAQATLKKFGVRV